MSAAALLAVSLLAASPQGAGSSPPGGRAIDGPGSQAQHASHANPTELGPAELLRTQTEFQQVIDAVSPSVVSIRVHRRGAMTFFGGVSEFEQLVVVNGSGTLIRDDGSILTNEHVIQSAVEIEVIFHDGVARPANVIAADPRSDLAIIRTDRTGLPPARLCDWSRVARGQWTVALGNPYGLAADGHLSASVGVLANLGRRLPGLGEVDDRLYADMLQTTATINPGNSGGPLFNIRGELLGVVTAMHTRGVADDGVGFAIALTPAKRRIVDQLLEGRSIEYGYLGLSVRLPDARERTAAGLEQSTGIVVTRVEPEGSAARAGLRVNDLILTIDGQSLSGPAAFVERVGDAPVGSTVELEFFRRGERSRVSATVDRREVSRVGWMRGEALLWRGVRIADLSAVLRERLKIGEDVEGVVVVDVLQASAGGRENRLQIGDVIEAVAEDAVRNIDAFRSEVREAKGPVELRVRGRGKLIIEP